MRLAKDDPERFTAKMTKARRKGKIYIDYLRNERGASAIAPYSPRARETPSVATPVSWTELSRIERADAYAMDTIPRRLELASRRRLGRATSIYGRKSRQRRLRMFP